MLIDTALLKSQMFRLRLETNQHYRRIYVSKQ